MEGSEGLEDSINFKITTGSLKNATEVPSEIDSGVCYYFLP